MKGQCNGSCGRSIPFLSLHCSTLRLEGRRRNQRISVVWTSVTSSGLLFGLVAESKPVNQTLVGEKRSVFLHSKPRKALSYLVGMYMIGYVRIPHIAMHIPKGTRVSPVT